jgi:hypothetical protein
VAETWTAFSGLTVGYYEAHSPSYGCNRPVLLARPNREYVKPRAALGLFFHAGMAHVLVCYGSRVSSKTIG